MTDVSASFGQWQMRHIEKWHARRSFIVRAYRNGFTSIEGIVCQGLAKENEVHAHHLFIICLKPSKWKIDRDKMIKLLNDVGIGTSVHYKPIHMHSYYQKKYGYSSNDFPNAKEISDNVITLPLYPSLNDQEISYITKSVIELWEKYKT